MIKSKVKTANNRLQQMYFNNIIAYPRVELSYVLKDYQSFLAHKSFEVQNGYFKPFEEDYISFNKQTSLLFLNTFNFTNSSVIHKVSSDIDEYFDMNLKLKKQKQLFELIEKKNDFISNHNLNFFNHANPNLFYPKYFEIFEKKPKIQKVKLPKLLFTSTKKKSIDDLDDKSKSAIFLNGLEFSDLRELIKYIQNKNERNISENNISNNNLRLTF